MLRRILCGRKLQSATLRRTILRFLNGRMFILAGLLGRRLRRRPFWLAGLPSGLFLGHRISFPGALTSKPRAWRYLLRTFDFVHCVARPLVKFRAGLRARSRLLPVLVFAPRHDGSLSVVKQRNSRACALSNAGSDTFTAKSPIDWTATDIGKRATKIKKGTGD